MCKHGSQKVLDVLELVLALPIVLCHNNNFSGWPPNIIHGCHAVSLYPSNLQFQHPPPSNTRLVLPPAGFEDKKLLWKNSI